VTVVFEPPSNAQGEWWVTTKTLGAPYQKERRLAVLTNAGSIFVAVSITEM
jgi:hypothetical protein